MVVELPGSAGHEVVYAETEAKGKSIRAMTIEEIYDLVEKFGEAAWRIQQAGFDSVELHGAHGYLIAQFMSPYVNKRNDRFGGSFINRMRFVLEIIERIKLKCGKRFPIGIRYSGEEWLEGARTLDESVKIAKLMEEAGLAFLDISAGIFEVPGPTMDPMYYPQGWNTYTADAVKKEVKIPVITSHTLRDPAYCEKILAEGKTDMVGLSRQLVADPYWGNKAKVGKPEEIRKCISCLVGCWQESLMVKREMRCAINPAVGDERFVHLRPTATPRKVAVVGGGPGGMETARIATLRGHKVTIFEKTGELGGAILSCCTVPAKNVKMRWYADWLRRQMDHLKVEVKYRSIPRVDMLKKYDLVVLATGGKVVRPDIPGIDNGFVTTFEDVLRCSSKKCEYYPGDKGKPVDCGNTVLVWGDHYGAVDAVERLGGLGKKVYVVTEYREFAEWLEPCHRDVMMKRIVGGNGEGLRLKTFKHPVTIINKSTILEIKKNKQVIIVDNEFNRSTLKVDTLVLANVEGLVVTKIGDAKKARNLRNAVTEGANVGLTLDEGYTLNANAALISNLPSGVAL
jgi:thioredoxin reductase